MNKTSRLALAMVIASAAAMLTGCNTARGIGQDTYIAYDAIRDALTPSGSTNTYYGDDYYEGDYY